MSVTTTDFGGPAPARVLPAGFPRRQDRVRLLPPLTDEQIAILDRAIAAGVLAPEPEEGWGTARMLGLAVLTGVAMVAGGLCALWLLTSPL